jgi:hypothetical protein
MAGTKKRGGASAPNTKTVWNFIRPAGKKLTLLTQKDPTSSPKVGQSNVHGAGSVGPIFIAQGNGELDYKTEVAQHEGDQIAKLAKDAGIPIMGDGGLLFDIVMTTSVDGIPKMTDVIEGCTIGGFELKLSPEGNMRSIEGKATNGTVAGARLFREA